MVLDQAEVALFVVLRWTGLALKVCAIPLRNPLVVPSPSHHGTLVKEAYLAYCLLQSHEDVLP